MTDEELIPRLRELRGTYGIGDAAADRIATWEARNG